MSTPTTDDSEERRSGEEQGEPSAPTAAVGEHRDLSAETPAPKAYHPPWVRDPDMIEFQFDVRPHRFDAGGRARIGRGLHRSMEWFVIWAAAVMTAAVAGCACRLWNANGWATLAVVGTSAAAVLIIGLVSTTRHRREETDPPPRPRRANVSANTPPEGEPRHEQR